MSTFERYSMENVTKNTINDDFSTESMIFKHRNTFNDEFYLSEVYQFSKKDIKYLKIFYKDLATFSNYTLFVSYEDEEKQKIYHISIDYSGSTLKKEKYFLQEDITLPQNFYICISVDLYKLPLNIYPQNTLEKVLRPTFEFDSEERNDSNAIQIKTLTFKSKTIETGSSTPQEIFNNALPHIINFQCLYKNDQIDDVQATKTTYTLQVAGNDLFALYHIEINREGETLHESKPFRVIPSPIVSPYKVSIIVGIYLDPLELNDIENERTRWLEGQAQDTIELLEVRVENLRKELEEIKTKEDLKKNLKCTKEETCCVCLSSPSKVLFPDCGHLCLCEEYNNSLTTNHDFDEEDFKCPMCRTKVSLPRIII